MCFIKDFSAGSRTQEQSGNSHASTEGAGSAAQRRATVDVELRASDLEKLQSLEPANLHLSRNSTVDPKDCKKRNRGRPVKYAGDPNSPDLGPEQRKILLKRIANRESARRMRKRHQEELERKTLKAKGLQSSQAFLAQELDTLKQKYAQCENETRRLSGELQLKVQEIEEQQKKYSALEQELSEVLARSVLDKEGEQRLRKELRMMAQEADRAQREVKELRSVKVLLESKRVGSAAPCNLTSAGCSGLDMASREEPDMYFIGMTNYGPLEPLSMLSHGVSGTAAMVLNSWATSVSCPSGCLMPQNGPPSRPICLSQPHSALFPGPASFVPDAPCGTVPFPAVSAGTGFAGLVPNDWPCYPDGRPMKDSCEATRMSPCPAQSDPASSGSTPSLQEVPCSLDAFPPVPDGEAASAGILLQEGKEPQESLRDILVGLDLFPDGRLLNEM